MSLILLRKHQLDQKAAVRKWVGFPARSPVPPQGARGTIVSATGSGKTLMAAASALECFPGGRILVTVPTLDLLAQTAEAWRAVGHRAPMVAVCSLENDAVLGSLGVRTTTNPIQLALWAGTGPVVVFATYASLVDREDITATTGQGKVRGPLEAALVGGERLYRQQMAPFDLTIVDEAHSTAGELGRPWAAIHDNARIPSDFRLYLTATPRILAAPRPQKGAGGGEVEIASAAGPAAGPVADGAPGARGRAEPAYGDDVPPEGRRSPHVRGQAPRDRSTTRELPHRRRPTVRPLPPPSEGPEGALRGAASGAGQTVGDGLVDRHPPADQRGNAVDLARGRLLLGKAAQRPVHAVAQLADGRRGGPRTRVGQLPPRPGRAAAARCRRAPAGPVGPGRAGGSGRSARG